MKAICNGAPHSIHPMLVMKKTKCYSLARQLRLNTITYKQLVARVGVRDAKVVEMIMSGGVRLLRERIDDVLMHDRFKRDGIDASLCEPRKMLLVGMELSLDDHAQLAVAEARGVVERCQW